MLTANDVVFAISYSGKSDELLRVLPYLKRNSIVSIALTGDGNSPLAQHADLWLAARAEQLDLLAEELRLAQQALGEITGEFSADDLLGEIFSRFCIGK